MPQEKKRRKKTTSPRYFWNHQSFNQSTSTNKYRSFFKNLLDFFNFIQLHSTSSSSTSSSSLTLASTSTTSICSTTSTTSTYPQMSLFAAPDSPLDSPRPDSPREGELQRVVMVKQGMFRLVQRFVDKHSSLHTQVEKETIMEEEWEEWEEPQSK